MSRECNLDAVAARNVLKVALASKVAVEEAMLECQTNAAAVDSDDPYAAMHEMNDECLSENLPHQIPTASQQLSSLDRIVECAEAGDCPVGEMDDMIEGAYICSRLCFV